MLLFFHRDIIVGVLLFADCFFSFSPVSLFYAHSIGSFYFGGGTAIFALIYIILDRHLFAYLWSKKNTHSSPLQRTM